MSSTMEGSNCDQESRERLIAACSSCSDLDSIADKLFEFSVISPDDNGKIKADSEKFGLLVNILMGKGSEFNYLVLEITDMKKKWESDQNKKLVQVGCEEGGNRVLTSGDVSEDWHLKIFLVKLASRITKDDFETMKAIIGGEVGFKANALEKIDTPLKMFMHMMTTRKINRYNTIYLQSLMWHLQRKDLMQEFIMFSKESKKQPVHFYTPKDTPVNGYKYLEFYVKGDISSMTVNQLDQLQMQVSTTLCVPPQFVILDGIQPSNSLLLTFMVPETSIETFISLGGDHQDLFDGSGVHIEFISDVLILREICSQAPQQTTAETSMETHLKDLLLRDEKLKEDLEHQAERMLDLQEAECSRNVIVKRNHQSLLEETDMYKQLFQNALEAIEHVNISCDLIKNGQSKSTIPSLQIQSCLSLQTNLLSKAHAMNMDKELLKSLLEVNSTLSAVQERQKFVKTLKDYRYIVQTLESRADNLQQENYCLKANAEIDEIPSNLLKNMLTKQELARAQMVQTFQIKFSLQNVIPVPTLQLDPRLYSILKTMTEDLTGSECNQLREYLQLNEMETLILETDSFRLLEIALQREVLAGRGGQPPAILLEPYLRRIERTDLINKYMPAINPQTSSKKINKRRRPIRFGKQKY